MKKFLAIYMGSEAGQARTSWDKLDEAGRQARQAKGLQAWIDWGTENAVRIVDQGGPIGRTKRVGPEGISDARNAITGYVIVEAESHETAAKLFEEHPHFTILPGDSVEIMEMLPLPSR